MIDALRGRAFLDRRSMLWLLGAIVVIVLLRKPAAFFAPMLFADDATLFRDAWTIGWRSLFEAYNGYLLFVPRLVAYIGTYLPLVSMPAAYNAMAMGWMLLVCARIASPRVRIPYAWVGALALALVVHTGEVFAGISYIQFILALAVVPLMVVDAPSTTGEWAGDLAVLALSGLSGPFIIATTPLLVLAAIRRPRARHRIVYAAAAIAIAAIQALVVLTSHRAVQGKAHPDILSIGAKAIGTKVVAVTFLGPDIPYLVGPAAAAALGLVLVVAIGLLVVRALRTERGWLIVALIGAALFLAAMSTLRIGDNPAALIPFKNGDRYFYIPKILLLWSIMLSLDGARRRLGLTLLTLALLAGAAGFRALGEWTDYDWATSAAAIERGESTTIVVNPFGWEIPIGARRY